MSPFDGRPVVRGDGDSHVARGLVLDAAATLCDRIVALPYSVAEPGKGEPTCNDCKRLCARLGTEPEADVVAEPQRLLERLL